MLPRFYVPDLTPDVPLVDLPQEEARHLTRVLRLGAGDEVAVFDGRGHEFRARVEQTGRRGVQVRVLEPVTPALEPAVAITLAQAVLKGDHMDAVVRDATMMGAAAIQPVVTARTLVSLSALRRGRGVDRWRRVAIASAKQCRRAVVPEVQVPRGFDDYLRAVSAEERLCLLLVEPGVRAPVLRDAGALMELPRPGRIDVVVGPEGGWSGAEIEAAIGAECVLVTLGRRTLRADVVALVGLSALLFAWKEL